MPGRNPSLPIQARFCFNYPGGTKVGPGELLFACPAQGNGLACSPGEARRFHRIFTGMFAAKGRAEIGDDDTHPIFGHMERAAPLAAHSKWILRAGPDRQAVTAPLRDRGPRLQWSVLDVGNVV